MGLAPAEFYRLTYCELQLLLAGYRERQRTRARARREESAWLAAWFLVPRRKPDADIITPAMLMGRKPRAEKQYPSEESRARALVTALRAQSEKKGAHHGE